MKFKKWRKDCEKLSLEELRESKKKWEEEIMKTIALDETRETILDQTASVVELLHDILSCFKGEQVYSKKIEEELARLKSKIKKNKTKQKSS